MMGMDAVFRYWTAPARRVVAVVLSLILVLCGWLAGSSAAQVVQRVEIPSSPHPLGSGARALGMGSAFIAVADDATAASWNPGGLIQLEHPEISVVASFSHRMEDNTFGTNADGPIEESITGEDINYFSLAYPFTSLGRNMIVALSYQHLYDLTREWVFPISQQIPDLTLNRMVDYQQEGSLSAVGIAYCIQVTPRFSFGVTLNIWEDWFGDNSWTHRVAETGTGSFAGMDLVYDGSSHNRFSFRGLNANFGVLWNVNGSVTLGAVLKTPFTADLKYESANAYSVHFPLFPAGDLSDSAVATDDQELDMPMSYGLGLAYRFSDRFTASADVYRTDWQDFFFRDSEGNQISPVSGLTAEVSDIGPTHQIRMGAEYLFIGTKYIVPLRGGIFYDPSPAEGASDDLFGFSLGSGFAYGRFVFDIAYHYRFGDDIGSSILQALGFSQDMTEHTFYSSMIVHL